MWFIFSPQKTQKNTKVLAGPATITLRYSALYAVGFLIAMSADQRRQRNKKENAAKLICVYQRDLREIYSRS